MLEYRIHDISICIKQGKHLLQSLDIAGERWFTAGEGGRSCWALRMVDSMGRQVVLTGAQAAHCTVEHTAEQVFLRWHEVHDAVSGAGPCTVSVRIRTDAHDPGASYWSIGVENCSSDWTLWHVVFPDFSGLQPAGDGQYDVLAYPHGWGMMHTGWETMPDIDRWYPRGWDFAMQFLCYSRGGRTLLFATCDELLTPKRFHFHRSNIAGASSARLSVTRFPEGMSCAGNSYAAPDETLVAVLPGDWHTAACRYGDWARRQPWAEHTLMHSTERETHIWQMMQVPEKPMERWAEEMEELAARLGVRLGIHFYNWHETDFDKNYPDYFPARPGFPALVARMRRAGILAMPYINGRLWDINAASWPERGAEGAAVKTSAERRDPLTITIKQEEYGSGQRLAPMCPTTTLWQQTVVDLCRRIVQELGCDGIYLDQIAAESAELCFDRTHGHLPGGGAFWGQAYRRLIAEIRNTVGKDVFLTTECNWEGCNADFDGLLMWHSTDHANVIPLFPAVYSGQVRTFGCQVSPAMLTHNGGYEYAARMAMLLVWGAQLGWCDLSPLLNEEHASLLDYTADLCRVRSEYLSLFQHGRLQRTPHIELHDDDPRAVLAACWRKPDSDDAVIILVNPTREERELTVCIREEEHPGKVIRHPQADGLCCRLRMDGLSCLAIPVS